MKIIEEESCEQIRYFLPLKRHRLICFEIGSFNILLDENHLSRFANSAWHHKEEMCCKKFHVSRVETIGKEIDVWQIKIELFIASGTS